MKMPILFLMSSYSGPRPLPLSYHSKFGSLPLLSYSFVPLCRGQTCLSQPRGVNAIPIKTVAGRYRTGQNLPHSSILLASYEVLYTSAEPVFEMFKEPRNRCREIDFARLWIDFWVIKKVYKYGLREISQTKSFASHYISAASHSPPPPPPSWRG